jgi:hypothetical protein
MAWHYGKRTRRPESCRPNLLPIRVDNRSPWFPLRRGPGRRHAAKTSRLVGTATGTPIPEKNICPEFVLAGKSAPRYSRPPAPFRPTTTPAAQTGLPLQVGPSGRTHLEMTRFSGYRGSFRQAEKHGRDPFGSAQALPPRHGFAWRLLAMPPGKPASAGMSTGWARCPKHP